MKKLPLTLLPLLATLFLVGCGAQQDVTLTSPVVVDQPEQNTDTGSDEKSDLGMSIHMCLMGGGENCDEYLDVANKDKYGKLVQEQCDLMAGMKACDTYFEGAEDKDDDTHGDLDAVFEGVTFTSDKELSLDGYDIVIKHKDDIHAGEKITWTVTVMQGGNKIDGFEKIDGDDGVGIARHPDGTVDHLHPLAYTDNTLTFSVATEELGTYQLITQFNHTGTVVTVPYELELTATIDDDHGH